MRLDAVRREVGELLTIEWRAFLLRPIAKERTLEAFTRYTTGWVRPASMEPRARFRTWSGEHAPPSHSMPCAVAGKAVLRLFGADGFDRFHLALMHAYFAENRTISALDVIADVATATGLDAARLTELSAAERQSLEAEVVADHRDALARGIAAVPTVVIDDEYVLQGALSVEQYCKVISRLAG